MSYVVGILNYTYYLLYLTWVLEQSGAKSVNSDQKLHNSQVWSGSVLFATHLAVLDNNRKNGLVTILGQVLRHESRNKGMKHSWKNSRLLWDSNPVLPDQNPVL